VAVISHPSPASTKNYLAVLDLDGLVVVELCSTHHLTEGHQLTILRYNHKRRQERE
jgi:hypothetical protein